MGYTITLTHDGDAWVVTVPAPLGVSTFAESREAAIATARDVIRTARHDEPYAPADVATELMAVEVDLADRPVGPPVGAAR